MSEFQLRARKGICTRHFHTRSQGIQGRRFDVLRIQEEQVENSERGFRGGSGES